MAGTKRNTSLQIALQGRAIGKFYPELKSDMQEILDTLVGEERVEAVIERVQRYAVEVAGRTVDSNFGRHDCGAGECREKDNLPGAVALCIGVHHRCTPGIGRACTRTWIVYRRCSYGVDNE